MNIAFALLGVVLFFDCVLLVFLVLLQLPKKEAGAGMAFGGAATDALFGAGSGNALTTITRYSASVFFGVAILMAFITAHRAKPTNDLLEKTITSPGAAATAPATPGPAGSGAPIINFGSNSNTQTAASNAAPATAPAASQPVSTPVTNK